MKADGKDTIHVDVPTKNQDIEMFEPLIPEIEVRQIITAFVIAWIGKETSITFPTIKEVKENSQKRTVSRHISDSMKLWSIYN